jgi:tetratricopeptide (TPR) repeat protein
VAIEAFNAVLEDDPNCGIAYWGIALSLWGNPFAAGPAPGAIQDAWANAQLGLADSDQTERERAYLLAVAELYRDASSVDQQTRMLNYESATAQLTERYPDDSEARLFHALALITTALPTDKTYANQLEAAAILEAEFQGQPDHPGIAHYIIHSYDHPPLAPMGLEAARRYASIAPSVPHALHMPSHIFTRVGEWEASIATNIRSAETALSTNTTGSALHAFDYLAYAYLQTARDGAAMEIVQQTNSVGNVSPFPFSAIPARFAIEREAWTEATELEVTPAPATPQTEAMTRFVRAVGFARIDDVQAAQGEVAALEALQEALVRMGDVYWAEQVEIQRLAASAWTAWAAGQDEDARALLREAADREDATEKAPVTPGPLKPAREQLGDLLMEFGEWELALNEFEATMAKEPGRYRAVYGAARAAQLGGDAEKARQYYEALIELSANADSARPELQNARDFIESSG